VLAARARARHARATRVLAAPPSPPSRRTPPPLGLPPTRKKDAQTLSSTDPTGASITPFAESVLIGYWFEAAAKLGMHSAGPYFRIGSRLIRLYWNAIDICFVFVDFCPDLRRFFISRDHTRFTGSVRGRRRINLFFDKK
jgi:hypothetical protein